METRFRSKPGDLRREPYCQRQIFIHLYLEYNQFPATKITGLPQRCRQACSRCNDFAGSPPTRLSVAAAIPTGSAPRVSGPLGPPRIRLCLRPPRVPLTPTRSPASAARVPLDRPGARKIPHPRRSGAPRSRLLTRPVASAGVRARSQGAARSR